MSFHVDLLNPRRKNVDLDSLEVGDLIAVDRTVYQHWAVHIGDGEVVHLTDHGRSAFGFSSSASTSSASISQGAEGKVFDKAEVKRDRLTNVIGNGSYTINKDYSPFTSQEIRKRALSRVGEIGYNVLLNNCEHFARWWRYNTAFSMQVADAAKWVFEKVSGWFQ